MTLPTVNLQIQQGAAFKKRFIWRDKSKRPILMTGFRARLQIRATYDSPVLFDMSTENGRIILSAIPGGIDFYISKSDVLDLVIPAGAIYDLKIIPPIAEDEFPLFKGKVTVVRGVTQVAP